MTQILMTMMMRNSILFIAILFLLHVNVTAQNEFTEPLHGNHQLISLRNNQNSSSAAKISMASTNKLVIPFLEDFSYAGPYPDTAKWQSSKSVYVNPTLAKAPPTLGVCTFDGLRFDGYPYNIFAIAGSFFSDTLWSKSIRLDSIPALNFGILPSDSIYFSFYYQPEGVGDDPESGDDLYLDFKDNTGAWVQQWTKSSPSNPAATDSTFYRAMIPIKSITYFYDDFQFRFRNKSTGSGAVDMWHIDQIKLDRNRTKNDTLSRDVTFVYQPRSFLIGYSAIPFRHYPGASLMAANSALTMKNNYTAAENITAHYDVYDNVSATPIYGITTGSNNIPPYVGNGYMNSPAMTNPAIAPFVYNGGSALTDSITYTIKHHLVTSAFDENKRNDTLVYKQHFNNYFAYDDGTAEVGYGVNTYGGKMAVKYDFLVKDTLRAIDIYFDPVTQVNLLQTATFRFVIWGTSGSSPGSEIYRDSLENPFYTKSITNGFARYQLTSPVILNAGSYFIGLIQTLNMNLSISFDMNTNNQSKLYYDVGSGWVNTTFKASLMLRPILGDSLRAINGISNHTPLKDFHTLDVYPNPAGDEVFIKTVHSDASKLIEVEVMNCLGAVVIHEKVEQGVFRIGLSELPLGIYFVRTLDKGKLLDTKKLILAR